MTVTLTAREVVAHIRATLGPSPDAGLEPEPQAGRSETVVTGIATAWTPSLDVLRRAVATGANMVIARECAFWSREAEEKGYSGAGAIATRAGMAKDQTFATKQAYIDEHGLVIWRLSGNWDARRGDVQLDSLAAALGWQAHRAGSSELFTLPAAPLSALVSGIRQSLGVRALRVLGDPDARVRTVALTHGFLLVPDVQRIVRDTPVDVIVGGEPVEWEAFPYVADLVTAGRAKGMVLLGHAVSEEPGSRALAEWLKTVVPDVPIRFLGAGEPFWTPARATGVAHVEAEGV